MSAQLKRKGPKKGIDILNDDCLEHIMRYLPIADRVRLERVSRRWNSVSRTTWRGFKELNLLKDCWGRSELKIDVMILKSILYRCGEFLISLDLSYGLMDYYCKDFNHFEVILSDRDVDILQDALECCPNLQRLQLGRISISARILRALSTTCDKLVSLTLNIYRNDCDGELALLFERNPRLKYLKLYNYQGNTQKCLDKLNSNTIESISLINCHSTDCGNFPVLRSFRKLKKLNLQCSSFPGGDITENIVLGCRSLTYLSIETIHRRSVLLIAQLKNLETLKLPGLSMIVNDATLALIAANCKLLKHVDITYCSLTTDAGLAHIASLPDLEWLEIDGLEEVNGQCFGTASMDALRRVDCCNCRRMRDEALAKLISTSKNLEFLDLHENRISRQLLQMVIRAMMNRNKEAVLNLCLFSTSASKRLQRSKALSTSPFLNIVGYCDEEYRELHYSFIKQFENF